MSCNFVHIDGKIVLKTENINALSHLCRAIPKINKHKAIKVKPLHVQLTGRRRHFVAVKMSCFVKLIGFPISEVTRFAVKTSSLLYFVPLKRQFWHIWIAKGDCIIHLWPTNCIRVRRRCITIYQKNMYESLFAFNDGNTVSFSDHQSKWSNNWMPFYRQWLYKL